MAILNNNPLIGSGGQQGYSMNNSVRLRSSASAYLSRTPASAGSQTTWTWSGWVKLGALSSYKGLFERFVSGTEFHTLAFTNTNVLRFYTYINPTDYGFDTTAIFRDPSAWYHVVATFDTTNATAADRMRLYVNGNRQTAFAVDYASPPQNYVGGWNGATLQSIGRYQDAAAFTDGYMADVNFIDGQALTPSSFGETDTTTGVWKPKAYTGTYGTNGFYLKFSDIATTSGSNAGLGKDFSGNSNYWTTNNINVTTPAGTNTSYDAMTDSPTNTSATVANYALLNPLQIGAYVTASNGNLTLTGNTSTDSAVATATISFASGKYYYEYTQGTAASETCGFALVPVTGSLLDGETFATNNAFGARAAGTTYGTAKIASSLTSWASGDVVGIAIDADNGAAYWSKNGVWQTSGVPTSGASKTGAVAGWTPTSSSIVTPFFGAYNNGFINVNFGQRPFAYTPPTGFVALNTFNLPTPTILQGNKYMDATTYTGTGSSLAVTNAGAFKPDFLWVKDRSRLANHILVDSVRGVNNLLRSESTAAEAAGSFISSLNSNGFTLSANTISDSYYTNVSGDTFVGWQWQAGQGSTSSNTSGSITSTVSVNTTAGFSVVTYTGTGANATVGHGLGVAPKMVIVKRRNSTGDWLVWNSVIAANNAANVLFLNATDAQSALSTNFNSTAPTSTVFSVGTNAATNASGGTYVAYCWAEIAGYSKFGSYTGNGSTDGTFVYTGFRPKYVLIKRTDTANDWYAKDTSRDPVNAAGNTILVDLSDAEYGPANTLIDILSNGFKSRTTSAGVNASSGTYIYMAFAENPFKNALAR